ncbi:ATP-binding protein [Propionibacteriaceae bacterium Y2011]
MSGPVPPGWERWVDVVLQREALLWRTAGGVPPRPVAGVVVDDHDADRLLRTLPGIGGLDEASARAVTEQTAAAVAEAEAGLDADLAGGERGGSRFARLCAAAGLGPLDARVLALAVAVETDLGRQQLVAYLNDDVRCPRPTLALLRRIQLLAQASPDAPLLRSGLLEVDRTGTWAGRQLLVPERVCWHLTAGDHLDRGVPAGTESVPAGPDRQGPDRQGLDRQGVGPDGERLVLVSGADRQSRREAVARQWSGTAMLVTTTPGTPAAALALTREAVVSRAGVLVETTGPLTPDVVAVIEAAPVAWALSSRQELSLDGLPRRPLREIHLTDGTASPDDWVDVLGTETHLPDHPLDREQLRLLARSIDREGPHDPAEVVVRGIRRLASGQLDRHAVRTSPSYGWDDLVLPPELIMQLRELTSRYRHRRTVYQGWGFRPVPSTGIVALFAGPSGTGKTMAAEVIAGDLGLDLYRVDLASVVSKYIGETEKNLDQIFDAARAAAAVLLFDEADALFGKRTEVSDAHDRYANIEVSYLLQRLDSYDGCVIMTTNLRRNIDQAFVRRLTATVEFPSPDEEQRLDLWHRNLPAAAPTVGLDLDFMADRFAVTGGMIRNVAVAAAFLAAEQQQPIGMEHLVLAMKRELQKAGRLQTEADFGPYYHLITDEQATTDASRKAG